MSSSDNDIKDAEEYVKFKPNPNSWERTAIILRNDLGNRLREGIKEQEPIVLKDFAGLDLNRAQIRLASVKGGKPLSFHVDLIGGQKTGFFFKDTSSDQAQLSAPTAV